MKTKSSAYLKQVIWLSLPLNIPSVTSSIPLSAMLAKSGEITSLTLAILLSAIAAGAWLIGNALDE
ncbi:hypothetical protein [Nostoc sp.]|uniref:hypothetical protein n=1 Tax=Nostoc sp. TaxID=1180 RepID=UPI002FFBD0E2